MMNGSERVKSNPQLTKCPLSPCQDKFLFADKDEAAGAADATAWMGRERSGVADVVWVIGKGDSCDPITKNDAGRTPASQLF